MLPGELFLLVINNSKAIKSKDCMPKRYTQIRANNKCIGIIVIP